MGAFISVRAQAASDACVHRFVAQLAKCSPMACEGKDPRIEGQQVHLQIQGRRGGFCMADGSVPQRGGLHCALTAASVKYLTTPSTLRAIESPDLRVSLRT